MEALFGRFYLWRKLLYIRRLQIRNLMTKGKTDRYIVVTLEVQDGERSYIHELFAQLRSGESVQRCAERNARTYYSDGRKVRGEDYYETAGGELLIKIIRYVKVEVIDVLVLQKYFQSV